jgi:hypothetical protein
MHKGLLFFCTDLIFVYNFFIPFVNNRYAEVSIKDNRRRENCFCPPILPRHGGSGEERACPPTRLKFRPRNSKRRKKMSSVENKVTEVLIFLKQNQNMSKITDVLFIRKPILIQKFARCTEYTVLPFCNLTMRAYFLFQEPTFSAKLAGNSCLELATLPARPNSSISCHQHSAPAILRAHFYTPSIQQDWLTQIYHAALFFCT